MSNYFKRHVFSPLMGRGWKFNQAAFVVFLLSAFLHELAVGVPTHMLIGEKYARPVISTQPLILFLLGVAFFAMLFQLVLMAATRPFDKATSPGTRMVGNCFFWFVFSIFGQPFVALCYFYAWQHKFGSISDKWASERGT